MAKPLPDKKPSLDEILNRAIAVYSEDGKMKVVIQGKLREEARTAIEALVPEKKPQTKYLGKRHSLIQGWNNAVEEMLRRLSGDG